MKTVLPWVLVGAIIGAIGYNLIYSWLNPSKTEYMYVGDLAHGFDYYADSLGDSVIVYTTVTNMWPDEEVVSSGANTDWKLKTAVDEPVSFSLDTVKRTIIPPIVLFKDRVLRLGGWEPLDTAKDTLQEYEVTATHQNFSIVMSLMAKDLQEVKIKEVHFADTTRIEVYPEYLTPTPRSRWGRASFDKAEEKTGTAYKSKFYLQAVIGCAWNTMGATEGIKPVGGLTLGFRELPITLGAGFVADQWIAPLIIWRF